MTNQYRYKLTPTGAGSQKYGLCEICGRPVTETFSQSEERQYTRPDGTQGWTQTKVVFGHRECLEARRKTVTFEMNDKAYHTDKETLDMLRSLKPGYEETRDSSAFQYAMVLGEMGGRIVEEKSNSQLLD